MGPVSYPEIGIGITGTFSPRAALLRISKTVITSDDMHGKDETADSL